MKVVPPQPPKRNNRKPCFTIGCITVSAGTHDDDVDDGKRAAQERLRLGFLRRMLPVPARQSIGKLQRRNFNVLGSCTACCRFLHGSL